jgi:Sulfotransferase family
MMHLKEESRYWRRRIWSLFAARRYAGLFGNVSAYCMFIGQARSGSTLVGALLTAHPEIAIGHELDALKYVRRGISRTQLYALLLEHDRRFIKHGANAQEFRYLVPNQWQGRFQTLKVIGDKRAAATTMHLGRTPESLGRLRELVQVPLRMVHLVRNPFDNISTMARRSGKSLEQTIDRYFVATDVNARLIETCGSSEIFTLRHEDLIGQPKEHLKQLIEFMGLQADDRYLTDCASVLFTAPSKTRLKAPWTKELIDQVQSRNARYPFLHGYTFES